MKLEKKVCPYCGEEIMAAAKKCKWCGEWLDKEESAPTPETIAMQSPMNVAEQSTKTTAKHYSVNVSKALVYIIMAIVALISVYNVYFESQCIIDTYYYVFSETLPLTYALIFILAAVVLSVVCIKKNKLLVCLRSWIALEVLCLCAPIEMIIVSNYFYEYLMYSNYTSTPILSTLILGILTFFLTKRLSNKMMVNVFVLWSIFYVLFSIIMIFLTL